MAAPNIATLTAIYGKTALARLTGTGAVAILTNSSGSNKVFKIAGVLAANREGVSTNVGFDLYLARSGTDYYMARNVTIPALAAYEAIVKDSTPIYMEEGDVLYVKSGNASGLIDVMVAYEEIS